VVWTLEAARALGGRLAKHWRNGLRCGARTNKPFLRLLPRGEIRQKFIAIARHVQR
jgi:hypothetical protein